MTGTPPRKTIMIIDDDPDVQEALRVVFEAEGFAVVDAPSAEEGLRNTLSLRPDAVIVDLMMESVDSGAVFARRLRETGYDRPVYLLSSAGDSVRYNLDPTTSGLTAVFQKPIDPRNLVKLLKARLAHPPA